MNLLNTGCFVTDVIFFNTEYYLAEAHTVNDLLLLPETNPYTCQNRSVIPCSI